ncbi:MAG: hypothetical protein JXQ65_16810 [Candidatus Marinimicrobia bacterium]|nr:hypothetical protein [Candidatus Neomarinimicrobiota bacterium]
MLEPGLNATKSQKLVMYVLSLIIVGLVFHFVYVRVTADHLNTKDDKMLGRMEEVEK